MRSFIKEMPIIGSIAKNIASLRRKMKGRIGSYIFYRKNKQFLSKNKILEGNTSGKRCFILATGPSINSQDLSGLSGELCISVSNFFVHPDFKKIRPSYHIFAPSHDPIPDRQIVIWFQDAEKHFAKGQEVFVALHDKTLVDTHNIFAEQKIHYYQIDYNQTKVINSINFTKRIPAIQTVNHLAIYLAIYIGSKEIHLLGCDHNWILNFGKSKHFYDEKNNALVREGYDENKGRNIENEFKNYLSLWRIYRNIEAYIKKQNIKIFNSTPGSLLDIFPQKSVEKALQER